MWTGDDAASRAYLTYLRRCPDVRGKLGVGRVLARRLSALRIVGENGARFELDPADWISWLIAREGAYESASLKRASALMARGGVLLDIGAAWGLYSCTLGVLPGVEVIAVEPTARSFERLVRNAAINRVRGRFVNAALDASARLLPMGLDVAGNDLTARVIEGGGDRFVSAVTPRDLLSSLKPAAIRLLKIDVEGHEWPILDAFPWADLPPDWLMVELYEKYLADRGMTRAGALQFLADRGYEPREQHDDNVFFERVR